MEIKKLSYDVMFKAVFMREKKILLKMIKDILDIKEDISIETVEIMPGYEVEPLSQNKRTFKTDLLIKLNDDTYVNLEINRRSNDDILYRNVLQLSRIYSEVINEGSDLVEISKKMLRELNFNTFKTYSGKPVENIALCEVESGKVINMLFNICNIDIELSRNIMYNKNIEKENRAIKWGALLDSDSTSDIDRIIGKDILSMEEKESLINTIKEVNNDKKILQEWMLEENARLSFEGEINTARREGIEEGAISKERELIISMLKKKMDYETISDITGKSTQAIKEIEREIK